MTALLLLVWNFIKKHWKGILLVSAFIVVLSYVAGFSTFCSSGPKVDLETVDKINSKNEKEAHKALEEAVNKNLDVIKSADESTTLSDLDIETRQKESDKKVAELEKKVEDVQKQGRNVTQEELECMLVPEHCQ